METLANILLDFLARILYLGFALIWWGFILMVLIAPVAAVFVLIKYRSKKPGETPPNQPSETPPKQGAAMKLGLTNLAKVLAAVVVLGGAGAAAWFFDLEEWFVEPSPAPVAWSPPEPRLEDVETILGAQLTGLKEKPGMTRAGPAILQLDYLGSSSFAIRIYLPPLKEFEGPVIVAVNRVVDGKGGELYDPPHDPKMKQSFVPPLFRRIHTVHLKSGADAKSLERVEGTLKLTLAMKPVVASFEAADMRKAQTVHGVEISLLKVKGNDVTFKFRGDRTRVVSATGFGADQKPAEMESWLWTEWHGGGGGWMSYGFRAPVARVEFVVAESLAQREFPFTLTRTPVAGSLHKGR